MPARSAATDSAVIVFDKVVQIGTATASASGVWLFTTGSLARGANAFVSMAVDVAADVSSISTALNASISTAASVAPVAIPIINDYAIVDSDQVALTGRPRQHAPYRSDSGHATTR
jgi:hypothetical protein